MNTRQHLVEEWKVKLTASAQTDKDGEQRFAWVRQIYTRIFRFLISYYGEGEWRGAGEDSSARADLSSNASRMPFVDNCPATDGLAPKSRERIRAALDSIHGSNPGIATAGTMSGVGDDTWIVVAAKKKPQFARAVHRNLIACGIEARLLDRTTDMAVIVQYEDFQKALAVVQGVGRRRQIQISAKAKVDPLEAVGLILLIASALTFLAFILLNVATQPALPLAACALWIAGLASGWLLFRGRRPR